MPDRRLPEPPETGGTPQPILTHPHAALRQRAAPLSDFGGRVEALARDMLATMYAAGGSGLAAPQIGVGQRIFVMDEGWKNGAPAPWIICNPELFEVADDVTAAPENCLSIPGVWIDIERPTWVRLSWHDAEGGTHQGRFEGAEAVCVFHEYDHLEGVLIVDPVHGQT